MAQGYDTDQGFPRLGARTDTWALFGQTMGLVAMTTGLFPPSRPAGRVCGPATGAQGKHQSKHQPNPGTKKEET